MRKQTAAIAWDLLLPVYQIQSVLFHVLEMRNVYRHNRQRSIILTYFPRTQKCGGLTQLSIYKKGKPLPPAPVTNPGPPGFSSLGCWGVTGANQLLSVALPVPGGPGALNINLCTSACNGYNYVGVKNKEECCELPKTPGAPILTYYIDRLWQYLAE